MSLRMMVLGGRLRNGGRAPGTRAEFPRFARGSSQSSLCPPALRRLCRQGMPVCPGLLRGSPLGNIPRKSVAGALALGIFVCHQRLNSTPTCGVKSFPDKGEDMELFFKSKQLRPQVVTAAMQVAERGRRRS
ncbi:uncharacterized protein LOC120499636 isoform X5 [Passer montanus]|uniref:uncharacterized protein LOC120499636 isoform X5 n=1 Tax=Passer montanus TaxID=9160 RepID=UPI001960F848|nr:uncharacterized protein LOC120499636 isoform X5 [Passer montanus]